MLILSSEKENEALGIYIKTVVALYFLTIHNKHKYLYAGGGDSECTFSCGSYYEKQQGKTCEHKFVLWYLGKLTVAQLILVAINRWPRISVSGNINCSTRSCC